MLKDIFTQHICKETSSLKKIYNNLLHLYFVTFGNFEA